ncbi:unnamed protein product [Rodentolepis nana]|uniref:F-box domain-containing protein n=1 Tax=Rodentolepis nana TaxID=102285 RepID=A0A158QGU4_RODNA|nr:unnamed protein product [Rodentolepis nana]
MPASNKQFNHCTRGPTANRSLILVHLESFKKEFAHDRRKVWLVIENVPEGESVKDLGYKVNDVVEWIDPNSRYNQGSLGMQLYGKVLKCMTWSGDVIAVPSNFVRFPFSESELATTLYQRPRASVTTDFTGSTNEELSVKFITELGEYTSYRKIYHLPVEIVARIIEYLDAPSIASSCVAIPYWDYALKIDRFASVVENHARDIAWLDLCLCLVLLPQPTPHKYLNSAEALVYQQSSRRYPYDHQKIHANSFRVDHVKFLILSDDPLLTFMSDNPAKHPIECALAHLRTSVDTIRSDPKLPEPAVKFELKRYYSSDYWSQINEMLCIPQVYEQKRAEQLRHLRDFSAIIIFIDLRKPIELEMDIIAGALTSRQSIIFAVVRDVKEEDEECNMDYLIKLYNALGGVVNAPLGITAAKWRLWCVVRKDLIYTNLKELLKWEYMEICSKEARI